LISFVLFTFYAASIWAFNYDIFTMMLLAVHHNITSFLFNIQVKFKIPVIHPTKT